jgi:phosphatidylserine synthase
MIITIVLFVISLGLMIYAHYNFISNTKFVNYDRMGASISFDRPFVLSILLLCTGLTLIKVIVWYYSIILFIILVVSGMIYKWKLLDKWVRPYRQNY